MEFDKAWDASGFEVALELQNRIKREAPVRTGRLRNSVKAEFVNKEIIINMVGYGKHVNFGTIKQKPNPFIDRALQDMNRVIMKILMKHFGDR